MPAGNLGRALVTSLFCILSAVAHADERILSFDASIEVEFDGSALVTETIRVQSEGNQIQRGIFRDLPTSRIEPILVQRDGQSEDFHTRSQGSDTRIYIGSGDRYLSPGIYTYTIQYRWQRIVRHFEAHDEVYWNVTGNQWLFPIDHASARVRLPKPVSEELLVAEAYTGIKGAVGNAYIASIPEPGLAQYATSAPLGSNEGLTIVLSFPKGIVAPPSTSEQAIEMLQHGFNRWGGFGAFGLVFVYYFTVWLIAGRDPAPGRIIPVDHPPDDHSPAACRYVRDMGYDAQAFSAAIVNLAYKGYLRIDQENDRFVLVQESPTNSTAFPDEQAVHDYLFAGRTELEVSRSLSNEAFTGARHAGRQSLSADYAGVYFKRNLWYLLPGLVLSLIALYGVFPAADEVDDIELVFFMTIFVGIWSIVVTVLAWGVVHAWLQAMRDPKNGDRSGAVFITIFASVFWIAELILSGVLAYNSSILYAASILFIAALHVLFAYLLRRHTSVGRELLDRIDCFKKWLNDEAVHPFSAAGPTEAAARYERFLPYAMALDQDAEWSAEFGRAAEAASTVETSTQYQPHWYHRRDAAYTGSFAVADFMGSFSKSFNQALDTASTTPSSSSSSSSSSGSGGGGSSGGGSGGGGGGGW